MQVSQNDGAADNQRMGENSHREPISVLFGSNVKAYRKRAGLTQEQLSERVGVTQKHLSIIETGGQFASAPLIGRISEALAVSPGDLFGGTSDAVLDEIRKSRDLLMTMLANELSRHNALLSSEIRRLAQTLARGSSAL